MEISKESIFSYYHDVIKNKINQQEGLFEMPDEHFTTVVPIALNPNSFIALDLGYGYGSYSIHLAKLGYKVDAVDQLPKVMLLSRIKKESINLLQQINIIEADLSDFPLQKKYDFVVCKDVLHFLDRKAIRTIIIGLLEFSNQGAIHYLTMFTNIRRRNENGDKIKVQGEANYSTSEFQKLISVLYNNWDIKMALDSYSEKSRNNQSDNNYFECDKVSIIARNTLK